MVKPNRKTRDSHLSKIQQRWIAPPKDKPWVKIPIDVMDGERWHSLSVNDRRMLDALMCQHFRYFQRSNGDLEISFGGFLRAGITHRRYVAASKDKLAAMGLIAFKQGIGTNPDLLPPTLYEITMYRKDDGYIKAANRTFVWVPVEVMESPAWCNLSINARRVMDRLLIENQRHKSEGNGKLRVSYEQFKGHGVGIRLMPGAHRELTDAGLLAVTSAPRPRGQYNAPNLYRLTFLGTTDEPATWEAANVTPTPKKPKRESWKGALLTKMEVKL